ncbi:uncharacterized protein LOC128726251 [Anopheles nili]|uniref:uncharacterized protein LOC128726251 n=1 Tax=Anopheles nili TaxID=185578 RepID=UPI00237B9C30|nr:uncharacterized protein LOC128726251 [Anopheles nili]
METPAYKFEPQDYERVYEPAEDSFLLLDALEDELTELRARKPLFCVEIGPGSGILITALSKCFPAGSCHCIGVDINPDACRMTCKTAQLNRTSLDVVNMNLLDGVRSGSIDLLVFNPPYVPTGSTASSLEEHIEEFRSPDSQRLVHSWAGGTDGRAVTDLVLADLNRILSADGVFYLLLLKENKPNEVLERVHSDGFQGCILKERRIRGEHLYVLRIQRINCPSQSDRR